MSEPITYVGIDAHKVELHVALLAPDASAPVTLEGTERGPAGGPAAPKAGEGRTGSGRLLLRSRAVRLCIAAAARAGPGPVPGDRAGAGAAQAGRADQDRPAGRTQAGGTASGGAVDRGTAADAGRAVRDLCGLAMTRARIGSGAGIGSANCCFAEGCTIRVARGPKRTGAGSMV